jgi:copper chaperone NosL
MQIWLNKLSGEVEIINGLNHYIGMAKINAEMFPELKILVYIIGAYIAFGLIIAITGNRKLLFVFLILSVIGAIAALVDMYQWGYNYGHNLDPHAPIQVPGLSYQPPLIGHKKLLNFDAYSYPDAGGWIAFIAILVLMLVWFFEWRRYKSHNEKSGVYRSMATIFIGVSILWGCTTEPQPIVLGKDQCDECKMTIMDSKFGAEVITKKGKVYKFDEAHCLVQFLRSSGLKNTEIAKIIFIDFENKDQFLNVNNAYFVVSPQLKSPMNSNAVAFSNKKAAEIKANQTKGKLLDWSTLNKSL